MHEVGSSRSNDRCLAGKSPRRRLVIGAFVLASLAGCQSNAIPRSKALSIQRESRAHADDSTREAAPSSTITGIAAPRRDSAIVSAHDGAEPTDASSMMTVPRETLDKAGAQELAPVAPIQLAKFQQPPDEGGRVTPSAPNWNGPSLGREPNEAVPCMTLAQAVEEGVARNPRLRVFAAQASAARAGEKIAFAPFLPNIGFSYHFSGYTIPVLPAATFVPATISGGAFGISLTEFGLQWMLHDFGRTAGRYSQSLSHTAIADLQVERARQTIAYEVAVHGLGLLSAQATLTVREQSLHLAEEIRRDTLNRLNVGVAENEDLLRADVEVTARQADLVVARQLVADARIQLNLSMGRLSTSPVDICPIQSEPSFERTIEGELDRAVAERLELQVAREMVAVATQGERIARADFLPRIYVRGTLVRVDSTERLEGSLASGSLHFDQALFAGGGRSGERQKQGAHVEEAVAQAQVVLDHVSAEVNLAYQAIASARERIRLGRVAVTDATETFRLMRVRYDNGNASPTDIVDAQTAFTTAKMRLVAARYDYLEALARLEYAVGSDPSGLLASLGAPLSRKEDAP